MRQRAKAPTKQTRTTPRPRRSASFSAQEWRDYEIEVIAGLEAFAEQEIRATLRESAQVVGRPTEGRIAIRYRGSPRALNDLRSVVAAYVVETFDVPRPRALLGDEHFRRLQQVLQTILALYPPGTFATFHVSAAGTDSPVMVRLKAELSRSLGLSSTTGPSHLLLSVRRPPERAPGWQVLARTSPRPPAARAWRVCDLPGALNATVANVMVRLANPTRNERFLNLACGSGTLLIERLELQPARTAIGLDVSERALDCARANLEASGHGHEAQLLQGDARFLPLASASVDALVADLPYGMLIGTRTENQHLYPAILAEAARVAVDWATLVAITADRKSFAAALDQTSPQWHLARTIPLKIPFQSGYIRPSIYVLHRKPRRAGGPRIT